MRVAVFPQFIQYFIGDTISQRLVCVYFSGIIQVPCVWGHGAFNFCVAIEKLNGVPRAVESTPFSSKMSAHTFPVQGTYVTDSCRNFNANVQHETPAMTRFREGLVAAFGKSSKFELHGVDTIAVSPFGVLGAAQAGLGYMKGNITYRLVKNPKTGAPMEVPGLAFIRGDSGAALTFLRSRGLDYVVMTEQPRVPICSRDFKEIPAGMLKDGTSMTGFAAAIAEEMQEEVGLRLDMKEDLKYLGFCILSPGGCDEGMRLFFTRVRCSPDVLPHLEGKLNGLLEENEQVTARLLPLTLVREQIKDGTLKDAKLILALAYYDARPELHGWACKRELKMVGNAPVMSEVPPSCLQSLVDWIYSLRAAFMRVFICRKPSAASPLSTVPPPDQRGASAARAAEEMPAMRINANATRN